MPDLTSPLGVYVHWPYCARICPYCDFNVYKTREIDATRWASVLERELKHWAEHTQNRKLTSLYFGGGTPSLAPIPVIKHVIDTCEHLWGFVPDPEITLEANPTDAEQSKFQKFSDAGINRLSLGVQSLRDDALKFLGRNHDVASVRRAIETAQKIFKRTTFDLIYARPEQSLEDWREELDEALSFGVTHLSLYQLSIEPGTAFDAQVKSGRWSPASDNNCADQFDLAQEITAAAGLPAYEISNHASPGDQSRHNLIYWRQEDYIGIGPGAHGRLTLDGARTALETILKPEEYFQQVEDTGVGAALQEPLDAEAQLTERLAMGLRLHEGMTLYADDAFYADESRVKRLECAIKDGLLTHECGRLTATPRGRRLLNRLLYKLLG